MDVPEYFRRLPTSEARMSLARRLQLPHDSSMQDWEWEIADPSRIEEFLDAYENWDLTDDERFSLMEIIIECAEESAESLPESKHWKRALQLLEANIVVHIHSVWYWAVPEAETRDEHWRVTRDLRELLQKHESRLAQRAGARDHARKR